MTQLPHGRRLASVATRSDQTDWDKQRLLRHMPILPITVGVRG